jgi:hypothetical protein
VHCPVCRDEYRPGFTRCATCDVDLVASLESPASARPVALMTEVANEEATASFCGFLTLDEARGARDKLRAARLRAEILVCEAPGGDPSGPVREEYWLRVVPRDFRAVAALVGFEPAAAVEEHEPFACSACGATVGASDAECPGCGLSFEE